MERFRLSLRLGSGYEQLYRSFSRIGRVGEQASALPGEVEGMRQRLRVRDDGHESSEHPAVKAQDYKLTSCVRRQWAEIGFLAGYCARVTLEVVVDQAPGTVQEILQWFKPLADQLKRHGRRAYDAPVFNINLQTPDHEVIAHLGPWGDCEHRTAGPEGPKEVQKGKMSLCVHPGRADGTASFYKNFWRSHRIEAHLR